MTELDSFAREHIDEIVRRVLSEQKAKLKEFHHEDEDRAISFWHGVLFSQVERAVT